MSLLLVPFGIASIGLNVVACLATISAGRSAGARGLGLDLCRHVVRPDSTKLHPTEPIKFVSADHVSTPAAARRHVSTHHATVVTGLAAGRRPNA
eukprot:CAMPEP_0182580010 /NCGR_PEP_ID=MMETSP1324-20130603/45729_1 /TAXON_ID=236786 /ORGANISM="Florenciella sp., Strain RCC1587" /LENGTH=94 /DNA_ID=CAMNT_0024796177 /DNA_START=459 /DNA_END=743 /DNA_ORIENTATION=+